MKFIKKPVVIDAIRWTGENAINVFEFVEDEIKLRLVPYPAGSDVCGILIKTLEGDMIAKPGDWIIKGIKGEFYPCDPEIFELTYTLMDEKE